MTKMKARAEIAKTLKESRKELREKSSMAMQSAYLEGWVDALKWVLGREAKGE